LRTSNLGQREAVQDYGSGMVPFERALVTSYRLSIVTFPLSLRISEILPLLCSSTPLFPTPPLVSSKFPHIPLGVGGWPLGCENCEGVGLIIVRAISLKISNLCDPDPPTSQTDSWWRSIVVRPPVLPACLPYPCARLTAGRVTTLWVKRPLSVSQQG